MVKAPRNSRIPPAASRSCPSSIAATGPRVPHNRAPLTALLTTSGIRVITPPKPLTLSFSYTV